MSLFGSRSWFAVAPSVETSGGTGARSGSTGNAGSADRTAQPARDLVRHNADAHRFRTMRQETDT
jgi:hypothetical protein